MGDTADILCICGMDAVRDYLGTPWCGRTECGVWIQRGMDYNEEVGNR